MDDILLLFEDLVFPFWYISSLSSDTFSYFYYDS